MLQICKNIFFVELVWNDNLQDFQSNYGIVLKVLESVTEKLSLNNQLEQYNKVFLDQLEEYIIEEFLFPLEDFSKYSLSTLVVSSINHGWTLHWFGKQTCLTSLYSIIKLYGSLKSGFTLQMWIHISKLLHVNFLLILFEIVYRLLDMYISSISALGNINTDDLDMGIQFKYIL